MHNTIRKTVLVAAVAALCLTAAFPAHAEEVSHPDIAAAKDEAAGKDGISAEAIGRDVTVVENETPDTWMQAPELRRRRKLPFPRKPPWAGSLSRVTADAISVQTDTVLPIPAQSPRLTTPFPRIWTCSPLAQG